MIELVYDLSQYNSVLDLIKDELVLRGHDIIISNISSYGKKCAASVGCQSGPWIHKKPFTQPSFFVSHGISPLKRWAVSFSKRNWSYIVIGGPLFDIVKDNSSTEVLKTGWPKADLYINSKGKKAEFNSLIRKKFNFDARPIVLFAPTYKNLGTKQYPGMAEELDNIFSILYNYNVIFMQHQMCKYKAPKDVFNPRADTDKHHYILGCDLIISDISSVIFEASLLDTPIIMLNDTSIENYHNDKVSGVLIDIGERVTLNELKDAVEDNIANPGKFAEKRTYWNEQILGYSLDGLSTKRLVDKIEDVI